MAGARSGAEGNPADHTTRAELVAGLCAIYDTQDAGDWGRGEVMGIALDEKLAKSDFIIDELMDEAYFLRAA
jgi:hypothetical protein